MAVSIYIIIIRRRRVIIPKHLQVGGRVNSCRVEVALLLRAISTFNGHSDNGQPLLRPPRALESHLKGVAAALESVALNCARRWQSGCEVQNCQSIARLPNDWCRSCFVNILTTGARHERRNGTSGKLFCTWPLGRRTTDDGRRTMEQNERRVQTISVRSSRSRIEPN